MKARGSISVSFDLGPASEAVELDLSGRKRMSFEAEFISDFCERLYRARARARALVTIKLKIEKSAAEIPLSRSCRFVWSRLVVEKKKRKKKEESAKGKNRASVWIYTNGRWEHVVSHAAGLLATLIKSPREISRVENAPPSIRRDEARLRIPPRIHRDGNTYVVFSAPRHFRL